MRFLPELNPLSKLLAPLPAMLLLVFVRDLATPLALLTLAYAIILVGLPFSRRLLLTLFVALPIAAGTLTLGFSLWIDPAIVIDTPVAWQIGPWTMHTGAFIIAAATALRLTAIVALALIVGLSTVGTDLVRALVQHLRIPYRLGYTALAALRFVPRFGHEVAVIRSARRVRGNPGNALTSPLGTLGILVTLLAGAIRHAERVALAMDARAFGAYPDRTERYTVPLRLRDAVFTALFLAGSASIFVALFPWQPH